LFFGIVILVCPKAASGMITNADISARSVKFLHV
jgi:hypothetical protein